MVRGPDLLWGGDVKTFHPPAGKFDGVIGGPPCQAFSQLRFMVEHNGHKVAENLIPEFERCVAESSAAWFLMENVPDAPHPEIAGYAIMGHTLKDHWVGGHTSRYRRFSFGVKRPDLKISPVLRIETLALHTADPLPTVVCDARQVPLAAERHRSTVAALCLATRAPRWRSLRCAGVRACRMAFSLASTSTAPSQLPPNDAESATASRSRWAARSRKPSNCRSLLHNRQQRRKRHEGTYRAA